MDVQIKTINNTQFVSKKEAMKLLNYANHNSIDHLIKNGELTVYQISGLNRKLIKLDEVRNHSRFNLK